MNIFFPNSRAIYPKIISFSISERTELNWMILEDLGPLSHDFNEESVMGVIKWVAWWHSLPVGKLGNIPLTRTETKNRGNGIRSLCEEG